MSRSLSRWAGRLCALAVCLAAIACAHHATAPVAGDYAFVGVAIVDVEGGRIEPDRTVVVDAGRIARISQQGEQLSLAPDVAVIDGRGRFLAPGLADMHVHIWDAHEPELYVAYGVTTVRNMWGEEMTLALRRQIDAGQIVGPRIVTSGTILDGTPRIWPGSEEITTPEAAGAAVERQHAAGYDFIKVYSNLSPEAFDAVAARARARSIPFAGHVPESVTIEHALDQQMASMEHLLGFDRATARPGFSFGGARFATPERITIARRIAAGELELNDVFDERALVELAREIAVSHTWVTPTLIVLQQQSMTRSEARTAFASREMAFVQPGYRSLWDPDSQFRRSGVSEADLSNLQIFRGLALGRVRALHEAGARILAGTDAPNPFVFHGASLHEELALLVEAGFAPVEAIRAATTEPAAFLAETGRWGLIAEGAAADLVLLSADPLQDVGNYRAIEGVMLRGRWLTRPMLDALRADAARAFESEGDHGRAGLVNERAPLEDLHD